MSMLNVVEEQESAAEKQIEFYDLLTDGMNYLNNFFTNLFVL